MNHDTQRTTLIRTPQQVTRSLALLTPLLAQPPTFSLHHPPGSDGHPASLIATLHITYPCPRGYRCTARDSTHCRNGNHHHLLGTIQQVHHLAHNLDTKE
jgi:hypothetical protein